METVLSPDRGIALTVRYVHLLTVLTVRYVHLLTVLFAQIVQQLTVPTAMVKITYKIIVTVPVHITVLNQQ